MADLNNPDSEEFYHPNPTEHCFVHLTSVSFIPRLGVNARIRHLPIDIIRACKRFLRDPSEEAQVPIPEAQYEEEEVEEDEECVYCNPCENCGGGQESFACPFHGQCDCSMYEDDDDDEEDEEYYEEDEDNELVIERIYVL
jgi:hypothetical protein